MQTNSLNRYLWLLNGIILMPFILLCLFVWPGSDDYSTSWHLITNTRFEVFGELYKTWGGRFSTYIVAVFNPVIVDQVWLYRMMIFLTLVSLVTALWWFMKNILKKSKIHPLLWAVIFFLYWLQSSPNIAESFYWYSGTVVYIWPMILLLFSAGWLIRQQGLWWLWSSAMLFVATGFNEMAAAVALGFIMILLGEGTQMKKKITVLIAVLTGILIVVLAPGNFNRIHVFGNSLNTIDALIISSVSLMKLNGIHLMNISLWLMVLLMFNTLTSSVFHPRLQRLLHLSPWKVLLAGQLAMFGLLFIPAINMGINPPLRVYTFLTPLWLIWFVWLMVSLRQYFGQFLLPGFTGIGLRVMIGLVALSFFTSFVKIPGGDIVFGGNVPQAWYDLTCRAIPYDRAMRQREATVDKVVAQGGKRVSVPALHNAPKTIHFLDLTPISHHWINRLYAGHKGIEEIMTKDGRRKTEDD